MFDEELQPPPQSYEFMSQQNHHQEYGHNSQFFSASREHFMSNLIDTNLQTSESTYAYMQSMPIPSFTSFYQTIFDISSTNQPNINDFVQDVVPDEQLQPQEN